MAIRYTPEYNSEIRRVVRNFNQKRNRAIKRGFRNLPPPMTVSELKSRYTKRADLNRELRLLGKFNRDDALESVETSGGVTAIKWELKYLKANIENAKKYYDRELYKVITSDKHAYFTKRELIANMKAKRDYLDLELAELNPSDYSTFKSVVNEYLKSNYRRKESYRGWLNEVEVIMRNLGYDRRTINKFFEGFETLTPAEFTTLYNENPLIARIYELYIPTPDHSFKLSTTEDDAKELISTFMEEKDEMIKKAKKKEAKYSDKEMEEFMEEVYQLRKEKKKSAKTKPKDFNKHDIQMIEAMGGTIEDLLK